MINIETTITIHANASTVWSQLTNFENYPNWNPFIKKIEGQPIEGTTLKNTLQLEGQKSQVFKPTILKVIPNKEFRWLGSLFIKGLFDGEHYFILKPVNSNQTELIHGENFSGILARMIYKMIGAQTKKGFEAMNEVLKEQCEGEILDA